MPGGNRMGPAGMGPMTGRGAGYCAGYAMPGYMNPVGGRGFAGRGRGFWGRGARYGFYATGMPGWARAPWAGPQANPVVPPRPEDEAQALKQEAEYLEGSLAEIRRRMEELEKNSAAK